MILQSEAAFRSFVRRYRLGRGAVPRMARRGQLSLLVALAISISVRAAVLPIEEEFVPTGKHVALLIKCHVFCIIILQDARIH